MQPRTLLVTVNAQHGTTFTLAGRYAQGESSSGAYAVIDAAGRSGVLKWVPAVTGLARLHEIAATTGQLRTRGYPAPQYFVVGCVPHACYSIQERLPGTPLQEVPRDLVPHLVHLNHLQRGHALPGPRRWPRAIVDPVLYGGDGFCLLDPLRTYSPTTAALLAAVQAVVRQHHDATYALDDVVHIDCNPTNILVHNGEISGVIDWHDPQVGDATFDLVTLLFYSWDTPAVRDQLWQHILARISPQVLQVYLAHLILRQVDWSIRHYSPNATTRWVRIAQESLAHGAAALHR
jgi:hypothetical protein